MKMMDKFLDVMGFLEKEDGEYQEEEFYEDQQSDTYRKKRGQLVAIPNHSRGNVKVMLVEPQTFDEAQVIADNLKNRKAVIINIEKIDYELGKRIIDFVGGTTYAISGTMQKIGNSIILAVPPNIDIGGELQDTYFTEQEDVFSWVSKIGKKGDI